MTTRKKLPPNHVPPVMLAGYLTAHEAAEYVGMTTEQLRVRRRMDRKRGTEGKPPLGPRWSVVRGTKRPMYKQEDLDRWLAEAVSPAPELPPAA